MDKINNTLHARSYMVLFSPHPLNWSVYLTAAVLTLTSALHFLMRYTVIGCVVFCVGATRWFPHRSPPCFPRHLSPGQYQCSHTSTNLVCFCLQWPLIFSKPKLFKYTEYNVSNSDRDHNCGYFPVYTNQRLSVLLVLFKPRSSSSWS